MKEHSRKKNTPLRLSEVNPENGTPIKTPKPLVP
ncbi:hypothetical protein EC917_1351 [Bacillus thuringiensis]|uniref:Uncharacterized protein n=1 Tax=Bacillus thuringiensis TaxID=1428 RepID=A0A4R4AZ60_BACTU|nr:hypothetical protein EC917_1351 [Bacillus thuringiensis]TCW45039.1 hypothetical protein EC910_13438 [Bacillus thuringiensis]